MYDEGAPYFKAKQHDVQVLHELSIAVHARARSWPVVGASGSGKTLLADAVLGLFEPNATVTGRIWFDGERMDAAGLRALRGHGLSLVPQSVSHLDPMMRVGKQVEGFANDLSKAERKTPSGAAVRALWAWSRGCAPVPARVVGRHGAPRAFVLRAHGFAARDRGRRAHARS